MLRDAATGIIWIENQKSLVAGETVMTKIRFEKWLWEQAAVKIKHLNNNNVFLLLLCSGVIVKRKDSHSLSLELEHNIKMHRKNEQSKQ